jgi:hypothetical protein
MTSATSWLKSGVYGGVGFYGLSHPYHPLYTLHSRLNKVMMQEKK